ncbi:hypothetical protein INN71_15160 [Nocardioides sp. ChNu-153]|uniref:hypothetical protein n=1 Tax=unclassified Nocardioides TaxID=2615069 RepID=UPI0024060750|nr:MULTISPECIES: hypothetical protein [unclassified Nocardioides]MDF9716310.1 hypothetical protein [Nocardioides sp. ChNu-99]MDN7122728.1 hypothetical protein [Nocardioides sp. ChNu-153]
MGWIRKTIVGAGAAAAALSLTAVTAMPAGAAAVIERIDDERGDVGVSYVGAYGPSFTPAVPMSSVDVEWVTVKQVGANHLLEIKVEDVFVYLLKYARSGDRRDLNVAEQRVHGVYRGVEVSVRPTQAGTAFFVEATVTWHADGSRERCATAGQVTFSRVHDLVGLTLPDACLPDELWYDHLSAGVNMVLTREVVVGTRTVSESRRYAFDSASTYRQ